MLIRAKAAQSTEAKILLLCAQTTLCQTSRNSLSELLQLHVDWNALLRLAEHHGLYTFLYQHLQAQGGNLIPQRIMTNLRQSARLKARHNFLLASELLRVKSLFDARNIKYFSFKGPCLAVQAYRSLSQRVFLDLDLIVSPENMPQAQRALTAAGYSQEPRREPPLSQEFMDSALFRKLSHEQAFARRENLREEPSFVVDLHWGSAEHSVMRISSDLLQEFAIEVDVCGQLIPTLKPELSMVLLCAHGTKHQWEQIKWLVDIAELLRSNPCLDWHTVYKIARNFGASKKLDLALALCARELGTTDLIPAAIANRVKSDVTLLKLAELTVDSWFDSSCRLKDFRHYLLYHASTFDSAWHAAKFLLHEISHPTLPTYLRCPLPEKLFPLYFLIHPAVLCGDFIRDNLPESMNRKRTGAIGHAH